MKTLLKILAVIALICVALPQLWYPYGFDQMVYAACGDVIRRGGVPIRDCFETKQMGVMLMYALPALLTRSPVAIHALTLAWQLMTSGVLAFIAARLFGKTAAWVAAIVYWLMYAGINYWSMDQAETFSNVFLALALYLCVAHQNGRRSTTLLFWAGVCIGVTFWFKYVFVLVGIALGVCILLDDLLSARAIHVKPLLAFAGGFVLIALAGVAYYALQRDGIATLLMQLNFLRENFPLAEPLPLPGMIQMLLRFLNNGADQTAGFKDTLGDATNAAVIFGAGFPLVFVLMALGAIRAFASGTARRAVLYLLAVFAACVVITAWQGNYIQYHFTIWHAPLALLASAAFVADKNRARSMSNVLASFVAFVTCGLMIWRMTPILQDTFVNVIMQHKTPTQLYAESKQAAHIPAAEQLKKQTSPEDSFAIFGDAPWLYTLAERKNATRFSFINVWIKKRNTPSYALFIQQFRDDLAQNKPLYVVLTRENFPWLNNNYLDDYKLAKPIFEYVEANYHYEGENGPFLFFRRN